MAKRQTTARPSIGDRSVWRVSEREAVVIYRRVLRLTDGYLKRQRGSLLVTDGRGLMTWTEIRQHIRESLAMKVMR